MGAQLPSQDHAERALADSEVRLQQVLDNSSSVVFAKDRQGRYLFVNREFERVTGRGAADLLGRTDDEVFPSELAQRFRNNDLRVLEERRSIAFEESGDFGSGERTFISSKFPLLDSGGVTYAVCGVSTDITERKRLEQAFSSAALAVSQSEEETLYRQLARYLSSILGVDGAFIATTTPGDPAEMKMLAFHLDGEVRENFAYPLAGTPCESVVAHGFRLYPSKLAEVFPIEQDFHRLGFDCYAGHPLTDAQGRTLGLIAAVSRSSFHDTALVEATLRIFAVRVNAELERAAAAAALRASEEQYRAVFNASADALILWDSNYRRVDVNRAYERLFGWSRDDVLDRGYGCAREYAAPREDMLRRALAGEACEGELESIRSDGRHINVEVHALPFLHRGEPHVLAVVRDITERKRAEAALRSSEEQYRAIFNASADGLLLLDHDGRMKDVNPALTRMFGYAAEELVGRSVAALAADAGSGRMAGMLQAIARCEVFETDGVARHRNGGELLVNARGTPVLYRGEDHLLVTIRDVTRRIEEERKLVRSEERLRATVASSGDCIIAVDLSGRIIEFNPMAESTFRITAADAIGQDMAELLIPARFREAHRAGMARYLDTGEFNVVGRRMEVTAQRADGEEFSAELTISLSDSSDGMIFIAFLRDVTAERAALAQREQLQAQLRQTQKMEAIGHLAGGIAHDFNNLLTSLSGYVTMAQERLAAAGEQVASQYLEKSLRSAERARNLVQQLLVFSRGQSGDREALSLPEHLDEFEELLRSTLPSSIQFSSEYDPDTPAVMADPTQIDQVLMNLCINARDAMGSRGTLRIHVQARHLDGAICSACRKDVAGDFVELAVTDSGQGIAPEHLERIFDPFFTTKRADKGTGMGLSTTHGIVHDHGGHILVDTRSGHGTTFRVLLPGSRGSPDGQRPSSAQSAEGGSRERLRGRVLLVDDDTQVLEYMEDQLRAWGLEIHAVSDPGEALRRVSAGDLAFDFAILDQTMPGMSGRQLARALAELRPGLPMILYTGYSDPLADIDLRESGLLGVLRKPVDHAALHELLRSGLGGGA